MNLQKITKLQKEYGVYEMQELINNGQAWMLEGSYGREAMRMLECGACMLPLKRTVNYYGNLVPSRKDLKAGTKGTYKNSVMFWNEYINR